MSHGFRSSFRDCAAEKTDHPREVIEAALAYVVQNKVEAAYARSAAQTPDSAWNGGSMRYRRRSFLPYMLRPASVISAER